MHVPDGFLDFPTSVATGAVAALALAGALRGSRRELGEAGAVRAGLTACFIFAAQMVNFPVAAGTSGHLLGGALAVALVGPWTAVLVMSCVLVVQALVFADGGVTALGTNIVLMGVVGVGVAALISRGAVALLGRRRGGVVIASGVGAFVSVPTAAAAFCLLYAVGGTVPIPLGTLTLAMVGTHLVIGVGEALITAAVVGAVLAVRPDLVWLAGGSAARVGAATLPDGTVVLRPATGIASTNRAGGVGDAGAGVGAGSGVGARSAAGARSGAGGSDTAGLRAARSGTSGVARPGRRLAVLAPVVTVVVAGGLSLVASTSPDGLEHVADALGFAHTARTTVSGSPLAGYDITGLGVLGTSLAGLAGVALTFGLGLLVVRVVRPHRVRLLGAPQPGPGGCVEDRRFGVGQRRFGVGHGCSGVEDGCSGVEDGRSRVEGQRRGMEDRCPGVEGRSVSIEDRP